MFSRNMFSVALVVALSSLPRPVHAIKVREMLRASIHHQPRPEGHFLTNHELGNITSVRCLEARQRDPTVVCGDEEGLPRVWSRGGEQLSAGNYPHRESPECNSETPGGYLCDPTRALSTSERADLQAELQSQRYDAPVQCGNVQSDAVDQQHLQPFFLGVALATNWPLTQQDPASLQWLGESLIARWDMDHLYTGSYRPYAMCPNSAMLIVLPDSRQAYLASESCEFICADRGGPEVVSSILAALDRHGTADAVRVGIREVYRILQNTAPMSQTPYDAHANSRSVPDTLGLWTLMQRVIFVVAVLSLVGSLVVGFIVLLMTPGLINRLGKRG